MTSKPQQTSRCSGAPFEPEPLRKDCALTVSRSCRGKSKGSNRRIPGGGGRNLRWESDFLPLLVLMRRAAAPVKPVLVIILRENTRDSPKIITSTGAKVWWRFCPSVLHWQFLRLRLDLSNRRSRFAALRTI